VRDRDATSLVSDTTNTNPIIIRSITVDDGREEERGGGHRHSRQQQHPATHEVSKGTRGRAAGRLPASLVDQPYVTRPETERR
jgi:hypothetical protein